MKYCYSLFLALTILLPSLSQAEVQAFRFKSEQISQDFARPMGFALTPDNQIIIIELNGTVSRIDPKSKERKVIAKIDVFDEQENGLLGIALDPDFEKNKHLYLLYSPSKFIGQKISRFTYKDDALVDEKMVIEWATQRRECCHHAGMLQFGPDGCLYASAGDNTHPHGGPSGYAPLDRREGKDSRTAEKSSSNTNDVRGGIIRIKVNPDASYSIPEGNLFPPNTPKTRPEIYIMGCRNPWKFAIDQKTGYLYWGDVGPDAHGDNAERGPRGYDEINQARKAGNYGWPYFIADNKAYAPVNYDTNKAGAKFDPAKPVNESPYNTGLKNLPPAQPAFMYWPYSNSEEFPILGKGGRTACAGPVYYYSEAYAETNGMPKEYDNSLLIWDWNRTFMKWVKLDKDQNIKSIEPFNLPVKIHRPSDARIGKDGTLWLLDYGSSWASNKNAKLVHITYVRGNIPPIVEMDVNPTHGAVPLTIKVDASKSTDAEAQPLKYAWSIDGKLLSSKAKDSITISECGDKVLTLTVTDSDGARVFEETKIIAGNTIPKLNFEQPLAGSFYQPGKKIPYNLHVQDNEEGDSNKDANLGNTAQITLALFNKQSAGLAAMKRTDCFNCHDMSKKLVGPSFISIADRYKGDEKAALTAADRIIKGSSKVWSDVPMTPHIHLDQKQALEMVQWIFSLHNQPEPQFARGNKGSFIIPENSDTPIQLSATFIDQGYEGASPLSSTSSIILNPLQIQAEQATTIKGPMTLTHIAPENGKFLGAINHNHSIEFEQINLKGIASVTLRYASHQHGAKLSLIGGDNQILASQQLAVTGGWNTWKEVTIPLTNVNDKAGKLQVTFENNGKSALMNLDWLRFNPQ